MFYLLLGLAAAASAPHSGSSMVTSLGSSNARLCYQAAEDRISTSQTLMTCDAALQDALVRSDLVATHVNRGILHLIAARHDQAEADFDRALALQPEQAEAHLNKGISRYKRGDSAGAVKLMDRAIALRTIRPALAYYARGVAREDIGDIRGAYADLTQARRLAPRWAEPPKELARYQVRSR
ncbi:MAG TPA: tetratricopeptide repeat protein [Sphingomicrobium sp.]|jgi:tetratricopeptide (TPR) repeat protein|nr:tetratricopeptide repeat protein [Sphingomicrobium sp.]